jgi:hypothetical protein
VEQQSPEQQQHPTHHTTPISLEAALEQLLDSSDWEMAATSSYCQNVSPEGHQCNQNM